MDKTQQLNKLALDTLHLSRNTLLVNLRFLDAALSRLEPIQIDSATVMTDGQHILYNPVHILKCFKIGNTVPTRDYLHIVMHCVFQHMYVNPSLNRAYWDLACDIAVENIITEFGISSVAAPREKMQAPFIATMKSQLKLVTAEKVYAYLRENVPDQDKLETLQADFRADDHTLWYMRSDAAAALIGGSDGNGNGGGDLSQDKTNGICSQAAIANDWKNISERMQMDMETFSNRHQQGSDAGSMMQNLAAVNREKYDYTAFLKKFAVMGETMRINDDEFDYIFYTYGLQLYGKVPLIEPLEYKETKAIKEFVIAIDTSGSTSGELVQRFVQKTYNILKSTESFFSKINLHIIQCDAKIQEDAKITNQEEFDNYLKHMKIHGLGGTDFRPVLDYVERLQSKKEFQNLRGLIYFTDGYGTFPARKPNFETAFVFIEDEYNNPNVPSWAIKLVLHKNEI